MLVVAAAELITGGLPELVDQVVVVMLALGRAKKMDQMELPTQVVAAAAHRTRVKTAVQAAPVS
jgi:hypothetical protein